MEVKSANQREKVATPMSFYLLVILVHVPVGKALSAELALVRLVLTVYDFVGPHLVEPLERLITDLTVIGSFL